MAADRHIVVGGGIAGLVAARRLALAGVEDVVLLEASDRLGGQLARHEVGGIVLDAGAEAFAVRRGTVAALATALGLGDDLVDPAPTPAWLHRADGTAVALPATSLLGIPATPLAADVIAAIGLRAALRAQLDSLMIGQVGSRSRTLGQLVRRRMGRGVLDGLVDPVVRGVHSASPDDLELDRVVPGLRNALLTASNLSGAVQRLRAASPAGSQVQGLRGGVFRLVEALEGDLRRFGVTIRTGARVASVEGAIEGADLGAEPLGDRNAAVVLADGERIPGTPVLAAPGITDPPAPGRRVTLVTLVVDAPALADAPRGTGVLVAQGSGVGARALTHVSAKWSWVAEAADGLEVLRLSYDGEPGAGLVEQAERDARTLLGAPIARVVDAATVTWERAALRAHSVDGMHRVGESVSGTGIAAVVAQADAVAPDRTADDTEPHG